jgi:16S rRNA (adenine1518-N6/adenine1519-N6)-dimethyltransferase
VSRDPDHRPAPPKRSLGQNFLTNPATVARIVAALEAGPDDPVVEIGPGRGALTQALAALGGPLVLVEKDDALAEALAARFAAEPRVRVVCGDATLLDPDALVPAGPRRARVVGNLPYNAGGPILFHWLLARDRLERLVFMMQKEVAVRLAAPPGDREFGAASVLVQCRARVRRLFDVSPGCFFPRPNVVSSVVRLDPAPPGDPAAAAGDEPAFQALVHALHAQPRKTAANSLADGLRIPRVEAEALLRAARIDPGLRPCAVGTAECVELWRVSTRS